MLSFAQLKLWSLDVFKEKEQQRNTQSNKLCKLRFEVVASTFKSHVGDLQSWREVTQAT